jgi:hypothetical protein
MSNKRTKPAAEGDNGGQAPAPSRQRGKRIPQPSPAVEYRKKGKKSINWRLDIIILKRLALVADLMLRNLPSWEIMERVQAEIGGGRLDAGEGAYSLATAKRDIQRVKTLWRESANGAVASYREESIALYRSIVREARDNFDLTKNPRYLEIAIDAQKVLDERNGLKSPEFIGLFDAEEIGDLSDDQLIEIARRATPGYRAKRSLERTEETEE